MSSVKREGEKKKWRGEMGGKEKNKGKIKKCTWDRVVSHGNKEVIQDENNIMAQTAELGSQKGV